MKTFTLATFVITGLAFQGCNSVKSDMSYRKGTEMLWDGETEKAIGYLREAVELDPTTARNHYHLSLAYHRLGDVNKSWEHIRHAYSLDPNSHMQLQFFMRLYTELSTRNRLEKRHPSASEVVNIFGVGDKYLHDERGELQAIYYGPLCLRFEQGSLASSDWQLKREPSPKSFR